MANKHPRVNIHTPGPGVGGHCLAVDPYFIYAETPETARLIKLARDINAGMPDFVVKNVESLLSHNKSARIAVFGVTYKPNVDDVRESPALKIVDKLAACGYQLRIHDPHVNATGYVGFEEALKDADMLLCLVGHNEFKLMEGTDVRRLMSKPVVFDVTGTLQQEDLDIINYGNLYRYVDCVRSPENRD
jgi:UDP-N-acetyl-D-mannosaminuronic acid dehydrogenase